MQWLMSYCSFLRKDTSVNNKATRFYEKFVLE